MTTIGSPKPSISRKSLFWQILFVVTLLLLARFLWTRTQPERLTTVSTDNFTISGEHLYMSPFPASGGQGIQSKTLDDPVTIQVQSVYSANSRTLVQEDPHYAFCRPYTLSMVDGNIYYAVQSRSSPIPPPNSWNPYDLHPEAMRYLGTFLSPSKSVPIPTVAGQTRKKSATIPGPVDEVRFRQVSMQGGSPRDAAILRGEQFCLISAQVFWIRPAEEETVHVTQGQTEWLETTAHSDLMLTSLTDGATRCIRQGVSRSTHMFEAGDGIVFLEWTPFPGKPRGFYARASDGIVHPQDLTRAQTLKLLPEMGGRLYWKDGAMLMSSKPDGADVREVLQQADPNFDFRGSLHSYRGGLYCLLYQSPLTSKDHPQTLLCRLHPDRSDSVEILRKLPKGAGVPQFDGGYLYFVSYENQRSLWATLTSDDAAQGDTTLTLCRIPLDH